MTLKKWSYCKLLIRMVVVHLCFKGKSCQSLMEGGEMLFCNLILRQIVSLKCSWQIWIIVACRFSRKRWKINLLWQYASLWPSSDSVPIEIEQYYSPSPWTLPVHQYWQGYAVKAVCRWFKGQFECLLTRICSKLFFNFYWPFNRRKEVITVSCII